MAAPTTTIPNPLLKPPTKPAAIVLAETEAQWLFTETEIAHTPSITDGMALPTERDLRYKGLHFILQVGIMLRIQQMTIHTAGVFFQRFLMRHSLHKTPANPKPLHHLQLAAVSLLLATKTDETIRRQKDIIIACCRIAQKNPKLEIDEQNKDYWKWRDTLLYNEDVLLEALCFDLTVESPYKILYDMTKRLGVDSVKPLRNSAWAFLCDSLMTSLCLLQTSRTIAGAALFCGARFTGTPLPGDEVVEQNGNGIASGHATPAMQINGEAVAPWYDTMGVKLHDVKKACNYMAEMYEQMAKLDHDAIREESSQSGTPMTPNPDSQQSGSMKGWTYKSLDPRIYENLHSELSDEEEDGELLDEEDGEVDEEDTAPKTNGAKTEEKRGIKRSRGYDGADDEDAG